MVAMRRGRMVGYLLGRAIVTPPTSPGAGFIAAAAGFIGYADHAVDAEDATDVLGPLYGALGSAWITAGYLCHYVQVGATDVSTEEDWHALGFGREVVTAIRPTGPLASTGRSCAIRRAGPEDLDAVVGFVAGLHRFEAAAPTWRPHLPETEPEIRAVQARMLHDAACACWIACQGGQPLAMQTFQPPPPYLSPMIVPDASVYLPTARLHGAGREGYGHRHEPPGRGDGLGAVEAGHRHCLLDFSVTNRVSARFWLGRGFRPIGHRLCRRLDERLARARLPDADA